MRTSSIVGFLLVAEDITNKQNASEPVQIAQKTEDKQQ